MTFLRFLQTIVTMVSGTEQLTRTQPKRPDFDNELNIVKSLAKQWDNVFIEMKNRAGCVHIISLNLCRQTAKKYILNC